MENNNSQQNAIVKRDELVSFLNTLLRVDQIRDVSCNGLQVQGNSTITSVALAVDACMEAYQKALRVGAEILLVHHGIIWNGLTTVSGPVYNHVKFLIDNDINLYAAHLPLDLHPELGNNAILAKTLKLQDITPFGLYKGIEIGFEGTVPEPLSMEEIIAALGDYVEPEPTKLLFGPQKIKRLAIVSGGAAEELSEAIAKGVDLYITGESSHQNYHAAREAGINVLYCGHYHSEKPGVQALGKLIEEKFGIGTEFIDIPTAV